MALQVTKKTTPLRAVSVDVRDLRRIVERLLQHVNEERDRQTAELLNDGGPYDDLERAQVKNRAEQAFQITVTITGRDGEILFGYGTDPFDSLNLPEPIASVFITNHTAFQGVTGQNPVNSFSLSLDFSTPPLVDSNNPVSSPTPNFSELTVEGNRESWVASVQEAVMGILGRKSNGRGLLHAAFVYDVGLMLMGFPFAIFVCWRATRIVEANLGIHSSFLSVAAYIYIAVFVLAAYRGLFGYMKWAFPTVELTDGDNRAKIHRRYWIGIIVSLIGTAVYDLFSLGATIGIR